MYTSLIRLLAAFLFLNFIIILPSCKENKNGQEEMEDPDKYDGPDKAAEFEWERTHDLSNGKIPYDRMLTAIQMTEQAKDILRNSPNNVTALSWIERGPNGDFYGPSGNSRANNGQTAGRIRASMIDSTDPSHKTVWVGGVDGGLWKTTDITQFPATWQLVNDFLSNLAVSAICQDPRPGFQNNMYFCTGESFRNADAVRGVGVFKSTDGGNTWTYLTSTSSYTLCTRIVCDYQGNVYLATRNTGLMRSTDGGSSWTVITPSGVNNSICDLEISSTAGPARLHMVTGIGSAQTYRYTDIPSTVTSGSGWNAPTTAFPSFNERCEIAVSGNVLYALPVNNATNNVPIVYRTIDGGDNWTATSTQPGGGTWASGQGWYSLSAGINPANSNEFICGGLDCYKTSDAGASWVKISNWAGTAGQYVHADQHNIQWWDGGTKLMFNCDGGVHFSSDGGVTIRDRNKGLRLKQFYSVAIHPAQTNYFLAGAQDNGVHRLDHPGLDSSIEVYGGDGCYVAIDQNQPQYQYGSYVYNVYRRSTNNGANWSTPVNDQSSGRFVNPWDYDNNANIIYACHTTNNYLRWNDPQTGNSTTVVPMSVFGGNLSAVHASPYTANTVYFGIGNGGVVRVNNANGGSPVGTMINTGAGMPAGYVNSVVTGSDDQHLIVTFTNYGVLNVWSTTNGGTTWTSIDGNLPDMPVRWALFHPDTDNKAFIATETGVWETDLINGSSTVWNPSPSFPTVRTDMIKYRSSDRTIAAGTHGRGVWSATIPNASSFGLTTPAPVVANCPAPSSMSITLGTTSNGGFSNPISFNATGNPGGTTIGFSANPILPGNNLIVTLNNTNTLAPGNYVITVTATASGSPTLTRSLTYTINPGAGPAISGQPVSQTVCAGSNASYSITSAGAITFQWQVSTDGGVSWNNISGATSNIYTISGATVNQNGNQYRCIAYTQCGSTNSSPASLTVNAPPSISVQPIDISACIGSNASFSVTATGAGLGYQWQLSTDGGGTWNNISGANAATYSAGAVTAGMNGYKYRVVLNGTCAPVLNSNAVTLTILPVLNITTQPSGVTVCAGANASFSVTASGAALTYQWQLSTDGGTNWTNISGATTSSYTQTATTNAMNGYRYRCNLGSSCGNSSSSSALLTVNSLPAIQSQSSDLTVCSGSNGSFTVNATATGIGYQWQLSTDGGNTWNNIAGANTATYSFSAVTVGSNGNRYRCVVSGTCAPSVNSTPFLLTVIAPVTISSQPAATQICANGNTSFSVSGSSTQAVIYQWQMSSDDGSTWNNIAGANASAYSLSNVSFTQNGQRYRCLLSSATCSAPVNSAVALLTVRQNPTVNLVASPLTSLLPGQTTTLTASPSATTGGALSYSWYFNTNSFANAGNTYLVNVEKIGSYQARIQEAWAGGLVCTGQSAIVNITAPPSQKLFIFPSPNDGRFTVSYYNAGGNSLNRNIVIYDSKGARIFQQKFSIVGPYTLLNIDIRPAQKAIYYVVVLDEAGGKLVDGKVMVNY